MVTTQPEALLSLINVNTYYGEFHALHNISLTLNPGTCTAIVGANGAGKSTLMQTIMGSLENSSGSVEFRQRCINSLKPSEVVKAGIAIVPEGRRLFASLSVEENLLIGGDVKRDGPWKLDVIYQKFPRLKERRTIPANLLSGGEQQMVAIGRALMSNPNLLLCDELSLGLSPAIVREIYCVVEQLRSDGVSILLVEQDLSLALKYTDYLYCMREGKIILEGNTDDLDRTKIKAAYFGLRHE